MWANNMIIIVDGCYCWVSEFTLLTREEIVAPHAVMIALILSLGCCQNKIAATGAIKWIKNTVITKSIVLYYVDMMTK